MARSSIKIYVIGVLSRKKFFFWNTKKKKIEPLQSTVFQRTKIFTNARPHFGQEVSVIGPQSELKFLLSWIHR